MKALVTGGAGFIGHHLVRRLLERGDRVTVLDDFSTGDRRRLDQVRSQITLIEGSILEQSALDEAIADCDVIFHEAAIPSVARSLVAPRQTNLVNVSGTIEVVLAAARHGVRRILFAGSSSIYGIPESLPCSEEQRPAPESPYGASKLAGEHYLHTLGRHHGIETVALRYFNVFGPGQDPASEYAAVVPRFTMAALKGDRPIINGSGDISRDFTYIDNVVHGNMLAATTPEVAGLTCNVACGSRITLVDLLSAIGKAAGRQLDPEIGPPRAGDIRHSQADISLAKRRLGYEVQVSFEEGIAETVAWFRDHPALARGSGS